MGYKLKKIQKSDQNALYIPLEEEVASAPAEIDEDMDSVDVDTTSGGDNGLKKLLIFNRIVP